MTKRSGNVPAASRPVVDFGLSDIADKIAAPLELYQALTWKGGRIGLEFDLAATGNFQRPGPAMRAQTRPTFAENTSIVGRNGEEVGTLALIAFKLTDGTGGPSEGVPSLEDLSFPGPHQRADRAVPRSRPYVAAEVAFLLHGEGFRTPSDPGRGELDQLGLSDYITPDHQTKQQVVKTGTVGPDPTYTVSPETPAGKPMAVYSRSKSFMIFGFVAVTHEVLARHPDILDGFNARQADQPRR